MSNTDIIETERDYDVAHDRSGAVLLVDGDVYDFEVYVNSYFEPNEENVDRILDIVQDKEKEMYRSIEGSDVNVFIPGCAYDVDGRTMVLSHIEAGVDEYDVNRGEPIYTDDISLNFRAEWDHYGPMWTDHPVSVSNTTDISPPTDRVPIFPRRRILNDMENVGGGSAPNGDLMQE